MPSFLADPSPAVYLVLLAFALVTGALPARNQDRRTLIRFGIALAVLLLVYLMDKGNESPAEEAVRRINAMGQAADAKNPDAFVEHVADVVEYRGSQAPTRMTKQELRNNPFWDMLRQNAVRVAVWDIAPVGAATADSIEMKFSGKGEAGGSPILLDFTATFRKQPDGSWKLASFASFKHQSKEPFLIPNLGR
jgi:hypothetical protein